MTAVNRNDKIFSKNVQLLVYSDNIDIIGRITRDITAAFSSSELQLGSGGELGNNQINVIDKLEHVVYGIPDDIRQL